MLSGLPEAPKDNDMTERLPRSLQRILKLKVSPAFSSVAGSYFLTSRLAWQGSRPLPRLQYAVAAWYHSYACYWPLQAIAEAPKHRAVQRRVSRPVPKGVKGFQREHDGTCIASACSNGETCRAAAAHAFIHMDSHYAGYILPHMYILHHMTWGTGHNHMQACYASCPEWRILCYAIRLAEDEGKPSTSGRKADDESEEEEETEVGIGCKKVQVGLDALSAHDFERDAKKTLKQSKKE